MCGIAGLIHSDPEARVGAMLGAIAHRGRDDEGVWVSAPDAEGRRAPDRTPSEAALGTPAPSGSAG